MIFLWLKVSLFAAALAAVPASALAQSGPWFAGGLGGLTFVTPTSGAVAGQLGARIAPNLFVIGEVGRMQNVMPGEIDDIVDDILDEFDLPFSFGITVPATYMFGGIRWVQGQRPVSPFVEGGIGFAHLSVKLSRAEIFGIDISGLINDELGSSTTMNKGLIAVGGGVSRRLGSSGALDVGYRYTRIQTGSPNPDVSMIYAAVKFSR